MPMTQGAAAPDAAGSGIFLRFPQLAVPQHPCKNRALRAPGTITRCPIDASSHNFAFVAQTIPLKR